MKILTCIILVLTLYSCSKNEKVSLSDLEINLENDTIYQYSKENIKDTINIISYSIKNNSSHIYYLNQLIKGSDVFKSGIYKNGINMFVYDKNGKEIYYKQNKPYYENYDVKSFYGFLKSEADSTSIWLGYKNTLDYYDTFDLENKRIFIHPNEKLYFEFPIFLKNFNICDGNRLGFISLNSGNKYNFSLTISSDSLNYKSVLPRDILKTINENNVKVYHGILESKNKVPIKVIE